MAQRLPDDVDNALAQVQSLLAAIVEGDMPTLDNVERARQSIVRARAFLNRKEAQL